MITDATGAPIQRRRVTIARMSNGSAAVEILAQAVNALIQDLGLPRQRIAGVGIAVAASLNRERTRVVESGFLGWTPFDLVAPVARITGLAVSADNIASSLALAETSIGVANGARHVAVIRASTQIGAAIVQNGQVIRGDTLRAGRVGHLRHKRTVLQCFCGNHDCLNCSASGWAILHALGVIKERRYNPELIADYALALEGICAPPGGLDGRPAQHARAVRKAGEALAASLEALCLVLEPEALIVGGPLSQDPDYIAGVRRQLLKMGASGQETLSKLRVGRLRAVQAAAFLALHGRIYSPELDFDALCRSAPDLPDPETQRAVQG